MNNTTELTNLYKKLEALRKLKKKSVLQGDDKLSMHCYKQIKAIKRVRV